MSEVTTEAAKRARAATFALADLYYKSADDALRAQRAIDSIDPAAIEAQAFAAERERIAAAVEGLPAASKWDVILEGGDIAIVSRRAVLTIVRGA